MFYEFHQNNSGGSFVFDKDRGISVNVIVEADSPEDANWRAEHIGLYFSGVGDCRCCGNRWYEQWEKEGTKTPMLYGEPLTKEHGKRNIKWIQNGPETFVHYKDGRIESFHE
jgi:hypothetical protein